MRTTRETQRRTAKTKITTAKRNKFRVGKFFIVRKYDDKNRESMKGKDFRRSGIASKTILAPFWTQFVAARERGKNAHRFVFKTSYSSESFSFIFPSDNRGICTKKTHGKK